MRANINLAHYVTDSTFRAANTKHLSLSGHTWPAGISVWPCHIVHGSVSEMWLSGVSSPSSPLGEDNALTLSYFLKKVLLL